MQLKPFLAYCSIFLLQATFSCLPCDCNEKSFIVSFYDMEIKALDLSGFQPKEVKDTVYRNAFGITVVMSSDTQEVSKNSLHMGFSSVMACDCGPDNYDHIDPVQTVEIMMMDDTKDQTINASDYFSVWDYSGEFIEISDFFSGNRDERDYFQFQLTSRDAIPESVSFIVELTLESGTKFTQQTQIIHFHD